VVEALARVLGHTVRDRDSGRDRDEWQTPVVSRLMQGALHALTQLVAHMPAVAQALSSRCLKSLIFNLLSSLLHPRVASQGAGGKGDGCTAGSKADETRKLMQVSINALLINVLKKAQANRVLSELIRFLYQPQVPEGSKEGESSTASETALAYGPLTPEFVEGVLKCLLEMARRMRTYLAQLDIDLLLLDIHQFLTHHPPSQYRGQEFKPLRLLKTMINELVKLRGQEIRQHLTLVPVHTNPTVCSYLDLVLKHQEPVPGAQQHPTPAHHALVPGEGGLEGACTDAAEASPQSFVRPDQATVRLQETTQPCPSWHANGQVPTVSCTVSGTMSLDKAGSDSTRLEAGDLREEAGDLREDAPDRSAVSGVRALALKGPGGTDSLIIKYQALRSRGTLLAHVSWRAARACTNRQLLTPAVGPAWRVYVGMYGRLLAAAYLQNAA
jgi:hypothetical protein